MIANLIDYAKANQGKTILVKTFLNKGFNAEHKLDSIENQKIKLIYIIDEIKKYDDIELSLVGHSQGGLVNLEAGISRNTKIDKLISISTPYAPVYLGEKLLFLDLFFKLGDSVAYALFRTKPENMPAFNACVEKLCSSSYYSDLKKHWDNLTSRPTLTVITGTAGHLFKMVPGYNSGQTYIPDSISKEPFDGLVKLSEQTNIQNANFIYMADHNVPCYSERTYSKSTCYYQSGTYRSCTKTCTLGAINFGATAVDVLFDLIDKAIKGKDVNDFANYGITLAIYGGLAKNPENVPPQYMDYYNIYSSDYNHNFIRYNLETIGYLLALLS